MSDDVNHDCASKNDLLAKWKRFDFVSIYMFNRDTESLLKSRHSDVAKMRKRNETISKHHLSIIKRRFEYDIYRNTNNTINSEIASFMKKLFCEDFAKFSQSKIFYKKMKIYFFDQSFDEIRMLNKTLQYSQFHWFSDCFTTSEKFRF